MSDGVAGVLDNWTVGSEDDDRGDEVDGGWDAELDDEVDEVNTDEAVDAPGANPAGDEAVEILGDVNDEDLDVRSDPRVFIKGVTLVLLDWCRELLSVVDWTLFIIVVWGGLLASEAGSVGIVVAAEEGLEDKAFITVLVEILEEVLLVILSLSGPNDADALLDTVLSISLGTVYSLLELELAADSIVEVALGVLWLVIVVLTLGIWLGFTVVVLNFSISFSVSCLMSTIIAKKIRIIFEFTIKNLYIFNWYPNSTIWQPYFKAALLLNVCIKAMKYPAVRELSFFFLNLIMHFTSNADPKSRPWITWD